MSNSPFLIVGLGNPGKKYEKTRHNVGFMVVDALEKTLDLSPVKTKAQAEAWRAAKERSIGYLIKPQTFMNLSGNAVETFIKEKKIDAKNLIVVHDDLDLPFDTIRISQGASAGGHNGVQSIIDLIGTKNFTRVRVGIDHPQNGKTVDDYVLSQFSVDEKKELKDIITQASEKILDLIMSPRSADKPIFSK